MILPVLLLCLASIGAVRVDDETSLEELATTETQRRQQAFQGTVLRGRYVLEELKGLPNLPKHLPGGLPFGKPRPGKRAPKLQDYKMKEHLGKGGFGDVWRAKDRETGESVAVKIFYHDGHYISKENADYDQLETLDLSHQECETIMNITAEAEAQLAPPMNGWARQHFCQCLADYIESGSEPSFLVYEECGQESTKALNSRRRKSTQGVRRAITGLVKGIAVLSSLKPAYMHHDLKPPNLCVTEEGEGKIIDWGAVVKLTKGAEALIGTWAYMPPEVVSGRTDLHKGEPWTFDMYAAGLIYLELLCPEIDAYDWLDKYNNRRVWPNTTPKELAMRKCKLPEHGQNDVDLIDFMANKDYKKRPSPEKALEVLAHLPQEDQS